MQTITGLFKASDTDAIHQFLWAKCAVRGQARDFFTFECNHVSDLPTLLKALEQRFQPITSQYQLNADLQNLRMRPGDFTGYLRKFNSLWSQL